MILVIIATPDVANKNFPISWCGGTVSGMLTLLNHMVSAAISDVR